MKQKDIELFTNDYYKLLLLLEKEEKTFEGKRYTPLLYEEMGSVLHCTRQTVGKMMNVLIKQGYVKSLMKGRVLLTIKAKEVIIKLQCEG